MENIKVSLAQLTPKLGDLEHNLQLMLDAIVKSSNEKSDIVVFPELFLSGYSIGNMDIQALTVSVDGPYIKKIQEMCKAHTIYATFGFAEKSDDGQYYISSALIDNRGRILGTYRKTHLFDQEKKYFSPGPDFKVIDTSLGRIGMMICFDVEFPETARALKLKGANLIIIVNANMYPYEEDHHIYARSRAKENEIPVIICNRLGQEGELEFCGDSMVINAHGKVILSMGNREDVRTIELPIHYELDSRLNYMASRRADLYSVLVSSD